jgi:hypothetical protein
MSFSRPIQWYHSHADPIWPDGTFKGRNNENFGGWEGGKLVNYWYYGVGLGLWMNFLFIFTLVAILKKNIFPFPVGIA